MSLRILVRELQIESAVFLSKLFSMLSGREAEVNVKEDKTFLTPSSSKVTSSSRASVRNVNSGKGGASASGRVVHWLAKNVLKISHFSVMQDTILSSSIIGGISWCILPPKTDFDKLHHFLGLMSFSSS